MTDNNPNCKCGKESKCFTVRKEGPNTGRKFYTCPDNKVCNFFQWEDSNNYNPERFKSGSCHRCGRWGCEITECKETHDYYGNEIPEEN